MTDATFTDTLTGKISVPLPPAAERALQKAALETSREPSDIILRELVRWLIEHGFLTGQDADNSRMIFELVDDAVAAAQAICRAGGFDEAITLHAIQACCKQPAWLKKYAALVGGQENVYKSGVPAKGNVNRELGFRIRAGIGGVTVKLADGKTNATKRVTGEIIQSYTPMAAYAQDRFGPASKG
jgi:hypothetical protein